MLQKYDATKVWCYKGMMLQRYDVTKVWFYIRYDVTKVWCYKGYYLYYKQDLHILDDNHIWTSNTRWDPLHIEHYLCYITYRYHKEKAILNNYLKEILLLKRGLIISHLFVSYTKLIWRQPVLRPSVDERLIYTVILVFFARDHSGKKYPKSINMEKLYTPVLCLV